MSLPESLGLVGLALEHGAERFDRRGLAADRRRKCGELTDHNDHSILSLGLSLNREIGFKLVDRQCVAKVLGASVPASCEESEPGGLGSVGVVGREPIARYSNAIP